jgi:hypothetical protein
LEGCDIFTRITDQISAFLERHFRLCAALFVGVFLLCSIVIDVRTKMWLDEIYTLITAQQANLGEIVKATLEGCDGAPPLYAMMVHAILPWVRVPALVVRVPSTLGYCGMLLCLLAFCHRRLTAVYSFVAALLACNACLVYATEGRGYGIVMGCAAGALLCWQAAADGRRRMLALPLLALCLALMTAAHYYSIFFAIPLCVAEMVRWRRTGKLDIGVLAAMASVPIVLGLHYPFIEASRRFQEHFWSQAKWHSISLVYNNFFNPWLAASGAVIALLARGAGRRVKQAGLTSPEWVAGGAFLLMPLVVVVLAKYTTHAFVGRYILWSITGDAVLAAGLLWVAARGASAAGLGMMGVLLALLCAREATSLHSRPDLRNGETILRQLERLPDSSEPIVVPSNIVFMELAYYAEPRLRERLIFPVSRELGLRYLGYDTPQLIMSAIGHRTPLNIVPYDAVLAANPHFILAVLPWDYLNLDLVKSGYSLAPIGSFSPTALYEAEAPKGN